MYLEFKFLNEMVSQCHFHCCCSLGEKPHWSQSKSLKAHSQLLPVLEVIDKFIYL